MAGHARPALQGLVGGHVHRWLGGVIKPSDGAMFRRGVLNGRRWRDVSLVLIPPFIACRKLVMHPFFSLKRGFDHGKIAMVWGDEEQLRLVKGTN
jgi:hypothetical protein